MPKFLNFDDLLSFQNIGDPQISTDGSTVAYVVAESALEVGEPSAQSRVWLVDDDGKEPRQVTFGPGSDDLPRWAPHGRSLAFRSDRAKRGTGQIYLLRGGIGEARNLTDFAAGVAEFAWSPDGATIAAVVLDAAPEQHDGADEILYEDRARFSRIWLIDVASGEALQLSDVDLDVWELCWSPDGSAIAAITTETPYRWNWYRRSPDPVRCRQRRGADTAPARAADCPSSLVAGRYVDRRDDQYLERSGNDRW